MVAGILGEPERAVRLLLAGDEFDTWRVDDRLVVKFPRSEEHAAKVSVEIALHPLLRDRLGALVPGLGLIGGPDHRFPFPFVGFEPATGVQGQTLDGRTVTPGPGLAADVAAALRRLHEVDEATALAAGAGLRPLRWEAPALDRRSLERIAGLPVPDALAFLEEPPPPRGTRSVLCHTDLKGEHVFVDARATRVTAIIDWADAEVCDPALDLAGLTIWQGPRFVRAAAAAYGDTDDGTLAERAIWLGR